METTAKQQKGARNELRQKEWIQEARTQ